MSTSKKKLIEKYGKDADIVQVRSTMPSRRLRVIRQRKIADDHGYVRDYGKKPKNLRETAYKIDQDGNNIGRVRES